MQKLIAQEFSGSARLPAKKAMLLAEKLPDGFVPHHSFHVLYLHTISGVIAPSVKNADLCRPSWGKELALAMAAILKSQRLLRKKGKLALEECGGKRKQLAQAYGWRLI